MQVIENLPNANKIDELLGNNTPKSIEEMAYIATKLKYKRADENENLAKLYHYYKVSEHVFNRSLDLIANNIITQKASERIPSIMLDLHDIDPATLKAVLSKATPQ